jgi:hypothetical protein
MGSSKSFNIRGSRALIGKGFPLARDLFFLLDRENFQSC